jgi:tRNA(fMet)-specific endonuclease VapC
VTELFMLDTDICAFILRRSSAALLERLTSVPPDQQVISVVTYAELLYGAQVSSRRNANHAAVEALARQLRVVDWTREAASDYSRIRASFKAAGSMIVANDLMIAAHASSMDATVVTNNEADYRRVRGLRVANWLRGEG